ncbi:hypothetical protein ABZ569_32215 [Streptomyces albus]|uniref:hypothetical protein n=1 Tax=Streptomyces albus TaxID=1888 RepID=UPI0033C097D3
MLLSLYMRLPRVRTLLILLMGALTTSMVLSAPAHAADIPPVGVGDLMPSPDSKVPKGQGTMYEEYSNPLLFTLDSDYGTFDVVDPILEGVADICMALTAVLGSACVVAVQWLFRLVSLPELEDAITKSISGAAGTVIATLLPTCLAVGALVAFANNRRAHGSALGQVGWLVAAGVLAVSLLTTPQAWVGAVDTFRTVGSNTAMTAADAGMGQGNQKWPFSLGHKVNYGDNSSDAMLRKSADAVWRTYVAGPWCVAEFGSFEVCQKHGKDLLDQGINKEKRKSWLKDNVTGPSVGDESVNWRQGHQPTGRIMVSLAALISVTLFAGLVLILVFSSLASLLGALMLLIVGTVFSCLWCIPGRPRQWGLRWADQVLARALDSFLSTMILGAVLILNAAVSQLFGTYGWLPCTGLNIAAAFFGYQFRGVLRSIVGVSGSVSPLGAVAGLMAARGAGRLLRGIGRGMQNIYSKGLPKIEAGRLPRRGGKGGGPADSTPQLPPGGAPQLPPGGSPPGLPSGVPQRPTPPLPPSRRAEAPQPDTDVQLERVSGVPKSPPALEPVPARRAGDGPPPRRGVPVTARRSRPALPAGNSSSTSPSSSTQPGSSATSAPAPSPAASSSRPSPALRPEQPNRDFTFRQGPRPGVAAPRVIRGQVVRRGPAVTGPAPTRPGSNRGPGRRRTNTTTQGGRR